MQGGKEKIALIVVDHGSRSQAANDTLADVVAIKAFGGSNVRAFGGSVELDAEPYLKEHPQYLLSSTPVPPGMLFVLGDNRNASYDSHAWGFVPRNHLKAKAFARYWPLDRIGLIQ